MGYPQTTRERIARAIIVKITQRTMNGIDKNNIPFVPYKTAYINSWAFKITNKSSQVTLRMTGEMLSDLSLIENNDGALIIGFDSMEQAAKAHGHIKGGGKNGSLPVRDFLGLPKEDVENILSTFPTPKKASSFEKWVVKKERELIGIKEEPKKPKEPKKRKKDGLDEWFERVQKEQEEIEKQKKEVKKEEPKKEIKEQPKDFLPGTELKVFVPEDSYFNYTYKEPSKENIQKYKEIGKIMSKGSFFGIDIVPFYKKTGLSYEEFWNCTNYFLNSNQVSLTVLQQADPATPVMWLPNSWQIKDKSGYNFFMRRYSSIDFSF